MLTQLNDKREFCSLAKLIKDEPYIVTSLEIVPTKCGNRTAASLRKLPFINIDNIDIEQCYAEYESLPIDEELVIAWIELNPNSNQEMHVDEDVEQVEDFIENIEDDFDSSDLESNIPLNHLHREIIFKKDRQYLYGTLILWAMILSTRVPGYQCCAL
ncbi:hypothetical protein FQA39_LY18903 [Lamprigera yunnana]|nr:hypothetical protein FQA39_LY18903 [Lamprigera yunnana]